MAGSTENLNLVPSDSRRLATLCGPFDQNIKQLAKRLGIDIRNRGNEFQIRGPSDKVKAGRALLSRLYTETQRNELLDANTIHLYLQQAGIDALLEQTEQPEQLETSEVLVRARRKTVKPRGKNQIQFVKSIRENDVNFAIGPAGTGKTYLAVACAVESLSDGDVGRIMLVRPVVEVGEKLGFLPGDLAQKVDPYLRPLYDALYEMMGADKVNQYIERNIIEIAPLAYMRGRTLNNAFIIFDESQNATIAQMKMFLTRIGFGSTVAITGDVTQIDLPQHVPGQQSGLKHVLRILPKIPGLSVTKFDSRDVVRHPIVQRIVDAYARDEAKRDGDSA